MAMIPHERSLVEKMKDKPFALLGITSDKPELYQEIVKKHKITWNSFIDDGAIRRAWGVRSWPTIYVLDAEGKVRFANTRGEKMDKAVEELLAEIK